MSTVQLYQTVTLIAVILFFDTLERYRPAFAVDRQRDLRLNILALLVVIVGGEMWSAILLKGFGWLAQGRAVSLSSLHGLPSAVKILAGLMLADFCLYWIHWAMHRPRLWRTHAFHHTIEQLWWLAGARTSLAHLFLFAVPQVFLAYYLLKLDLLEAGIAFSIGVVVNIWIHTNLWVNIGPLAWVLITPNFHRIHHGARGLSNKNLGFVFTFWDRLFGTYVDPRLVGKDFDLGYVVPTRKRLLRLIAGI